jgi:HD-GYP domain-containing protein (c-di-GMP phosphodiesterase class II)
MLRKIVRRSRIFVTLLLLIGGTAVAPLLISGLVTIRKNRGALEEQEKKFQIRSAAALADSASFYVSNHASQMRKIADAMKVAAGVADNSDPFTFLGSGTFLGDYRKQDPGFLVIRAINREGRGGVLQPDELDPEIGTLLDNLARQALAGQLPDEVTFGGFVRLQKLNQTGVILAMPVRVPGGEVFGAIEVLVSMAPVATTLIEEGKKGYTSYVVDEKGTVLLHSDPAVALSRPSFANSVDLVEDFLRSPQRMNRTYDIGEGSSRRRVLGTLAPAYPLGPGRAPVWGVIVEKDEKLAYAFVDEIMRGTIVLGVVALILSVLAAAFFARQLSAPIRELAEKSREIASGNYGQKVEVRSSNEIGELAETFNEMSDELEKHVDSLRKAARENQELFLNSIRVLAAAIDAKDPYTRGHSERVCRYSIIIAKNMNLSREEIAKIRVSALLHDVGKIGIDDRILRKPAALTDEEFEIMKGHPSKGAQIMESIPQLHDVIPGMKYHHEKWEGGGYPDGLVGDDIPMQARIVAVADTFDAMTTTRPYQKAMELSYVITKIKSFAMTRFDPEVVNALVRAYQKGDIALDEQPSHAA